MKRIFVFLMIVLVALSAVMVGCGKTTENTAEIPTDLFTDESVEQTPETEEIPEMELPLRFDGLYCYIATNKGNGLKENYALRFYEDGAVIGGTIAQTESNSSCFPQGTWFDKDQENSGVSKGEYTITETDIVFSLTSEYGVVDYTGEIQTDKLVLDSISHINGNRAIDREYVFYSFDEIND